MTAISLLDLFLIASGLFGWCGLAIMFLSHRAHLRAHEEPHAPTLEALEARRAVIEAQISQIASESVARKVRRIEALHGLVAETSRPGKPANLAPGVI